MEILRGSRRCGIALADSRTRSTRSPAGGPPDLTDEFRTATDFSARGARLWLLHSRRIDPRLAKDLRLHAEDGAPPGPLSQLVRHSIARSATAALCVECR